MNINDLNANRSAFHLIRVTLLVMVVLFSGAMIGGTYYFNKMLEKQHSRVFLLETSGNVASATSHEIAPEEMEVLVKDHISDFYRLFFGFDQFNFNSNTESALYLIGNSGKELMKDYKRDNVDRELKANNTVVSVDIEEILVDMATFPWRAQVKAIQTSRSGNNVYRRRLDSNVFTLTKVSRSPENPHGLMIDSFQIIDVTIVD